MTVFMVDRNLPGISADQLAGAQRAAIQASESATAAGTPVRYIRSAFLPEEAHCMCFFEAENADAVRQVNDEAQLPYSRIVPALDLTP